MRNDIRELVANVLALSIRSFLTSFFFVLGAYLAYKILF